MEETFEFYETDDEMETLSDSPKDKSPEDKNSDKSPKEKSSEDSIFEDESSIKTNFVVMKIVSLELNKNEREKFITQCKSYQFKNWCKDSRTAVMVFSYKNYPKELQFNILFKTKIIPSTVRNYIKKDQTMSKYAKFVTYECYDYDIWNSFIVQYINNNDEHTMIYQKEGNELTLIKPSKITEEIYTRLKNNSQAEQRVQKLMKEKVDLQKMLKSDKAKHEKSRKGLIDGKKFLKSELNRERSKNTELLSTISIQESKITHLEMQNKDISSKLNSLQEENYQLKEELQTKKRKRDGSPVDGSPNIPTDSYSDSDGSVTYGLSSDSEKESSSDESLDKNCFSDIPKPPKKQKIKHSPIETVKPLSEESIIFSLLDKGKEKILEKQVEIENKITTKLPAKDTSVNLLYDSNRGSPKEQTIRNALNSFVAESIHLGVVKTIHNYERFSQE